MVPFLHFECQKNGFMSIWSPESGTATVYAKNDGHFEKVPSRPNFTNL